MKAGAYILLIICCVLTVQPMFSNSNAEPTESSCCKTKCNKPKPPEDNRDCESNRCNPLMACPSGSFYFPDYSHISIATLIILKQKPTLVNDNRVSTQLTECWHPPEII